MHIQELYKSVTAQIIADLETGTVPWTQPWKEGLSGGILPYNASTKKTYNGVNIPILWSARIEKGYTTPAWISYKQARELGAQVRGGEKATHIVFTKKIVIGEDEDEREVGMLRCWSVFNADQVDGLPKAPDIPLKVIDDRVAKFIKATRADITHGGDRACYVPEWDRILLPIVDAFDTYEHYQATALHELCHWTGKATRLNRDLTGRFKTQAYAAEELVAEFGAAFLCAHLGIKGQLRHADYIGHWLQLLKADDRVIFTASAKAQQAADYLRAFSETAHEEAA